MPENTCICQPLHKQCDPTTCSKAPTLRLDQIEDFDRSMGDHITLFCTWGKLVDAADAGCPTCQSIQEGVQAFTGDTPHTAEDDRRKPDDSLWVVNEAGTAQIAFAGGEEYDCLQTKPSGCKAFPSGEFESRGTGTFSAFEQCRMWIKNCVETHTLCQVEKPILPHRVVDIGWEGGQNFSPRLHESNGQFDEYTALSHCWGHVPMMTTTTKTISERKAAIPWDMLSKTFQDAIIITRELGMRYIWIDSLCIIQDNMSDWHKESKKMGVVYGNSKVTIAVVKSKDGDGGCFVGSDKVAMFTAPAPHNAMTIRKLNHHSGYSCSANSRELQDKPLFLRAWTLQEELLAPRVIYYGPVEIVFQCRKLFKCQCGTDDRAKADTPKRWYEDARLASSNMDNVRWSWACIIQQYSTRLLTVETDLFPAISGLAKAFQTRGLGEFVAGMWINDLPLWLTWESSNPTAAYPKDYIAPSWSWASRGSQIRYDFFSQKYYPIEGPVDYFQPSRSKLTILNASCKLTSPDPTGAIGSGYLVVRGKVVRAELWPTYHGFVSHLSLRQGEWETGIKPDYVSLCPEFEEHSSVLAVHCLLLCTMNGEDSNYPAASFLVLVPEDQDGQPGVYKRFGIGRTRFLMLTKDCDHCPYSRPRLKISEENRKKGPVRIRPIMDMWSNCVEEQVLTLI